MQGVALPLARGAPLHYQAVQGCNKVGHVEPTHGAGAAVLPHRGALDSDGVVEPGNQGGEGLRVAEPPALPGREGVHLEARRDALHQSHRRGARAQHGDVAVVGHQRGGLAQRKGGAGQRYSAGRPVCLRGGRVVQAAGEAGQHQHRVGGQEGRGGGEQLVRQRDGADAPLADVI